MKTLSLRIRGVKTELEEAGLETEGMAETTSQLQAKLKALTHGKVDIMANADTFKNTTQILREVADAWSEMSDIERAGALELLGGKRQANILASVITNFKQVEDVIEVSMNSAGSAMAENARWLDSIEGKTYQFNNAVETFWHNLLDDQVAKDFISFGTNVIQFLDSVPGKIAAIVAGFAMLAKLKGFSLFGIGQDAMENFNHIKAAFSAVSQLSSINPVGATMPVAQIQAYASAVSSLTAKQQANILASQGLNKAQIQLAMQYNNIGNDAIREATAHLFVKQASDQESLAAQELLKTKILLSAESIKLAGGANAEAVADFLAANASKIAAGANVEQLLATSSLTEAQKAAVLAALGQANANMTLAGTFKALWASNPIGLIISIATTILSVAIPVFSSLSRKSEEAAQELEELNRVYKETKKTFSDNIESLTTSSDTDLYSNLTDEFSALARGVDKYGNNISLTSDQYERYKSICEQIVGINPKIASGYDSAARAIGNNVSMLEKLIEAQKTEARLAAKEYVSDENFAKYGKVAKNEYDDAVTNKKTKTQQAETKNSTLRNNVGNLLKNNYHNDPANVLKVMGYSADESKAIATNYQLTEYGGAFDWYKFTNDYLNELYENREIFRDDLSQFRGKSPDKLVDAIKASVDEYLDVDAVTAEAQKQIDEKSKQLHDELLEVLAASNEYDGLDAATQNMLIGWIKDSTAFNITDAFKDDGSTMKAWKEQIDSMIALLADESSKVQYNGETISMQDLIKQIYELDEADISYKEYLNQVANMSSTLWNAIGGLDNKYGFTDQGQLNIALGINLDQTEFNQDSEIIAKRLDMEVSEIQKRLYGMGVKEVQAFYAIDWNEVPTDKVQSWQDVLALIRKQMKSTDVVSVETFSDLSTFVEKYNEALAQTSEIVIDNTKVTQEYKDSLMELGISEAELNKCFDENNKLVVKDASALNDLLKTTKNNAAQNAQLAKSQARLQYYELYKQMAALVDANGYVVAGNVQRVMTYYAEMNALERTIAKYSLLEAQLLGTSNAFEEFQKAKDFDSQTDYIGSTEEMVVALGEAFNTAELGSETAKAAIAGLVPESVYEHLDTVDEKMAAIYDYFKNGNLAQYFDLSFDEDGNIESAEMKLGNMRKFIEDAMTNGVFSGEDWMHFEFSDTFLQDLENAEDPLQAFADKMKVTKEVALAFIKTMNDHDIEWLNGDYSTLFDPLLASTNEGKIQLYTERLADLVAQQVKFKQQLDSGKIDQATYDKKIKDIQTKRAKYEQELAAAKSASKKSVFGAGADGTEYAGQADYQIKTSNEIEQSSTDDLDNWLELNEKVKQLNEDVTEKQNEYNKALEAYNVELKNAGNDPSKVSKETADSVKEAEKAYVDATNACADAIAKRDKFAEPTEVEISIALDDIEEKIKTTKQTIDEKLSQGEHTVTVTVDGQTLTKTITSADQLLDECFHIDDDGYWTINAGVNKSELEQKYPEILKYVNFLNSKTTLTAHLNDSSAQVTLETLSGQIQKIVDLLDGIKISLDESSKTTFAQDVQSLLDGLGPLGQVIKIGTKWIGGQYSDGTAHASGTAHKSGNWGLPADEHNALVGELGEELVVDPQSGRYYTVGTNGAEMIDLKRGSIIFNHKQTEGLLKNGHIASRGKAYAEGNAHVTIWPQGSSKTEWEGTGYDDWLDETYSLVDALDDVAGAAKDAANEFKEVMDWIEVRMEELDETLGKLNAQLENTVGYQEQNSKINEIISTNNTKYANAKSGAAYYEKYAQQYYNKIPTKYRDAAKNGAISITDFKGKANEKVVEAIQNYRDYVQKAADLRQTMEELITENADLAKQKFDNVATQYENEIGLIETNNEQLEAKISLMEDSGEIASPKYYEQMIENTKQMQTDLAAEKKLLKDVLDAEVQAGRIEVGSDRWYDMVNALYDVDAQIQDCVSDLESFQNAINEIYWDNFDELISRVDYLKDDAQGLIDLLDTDDMVAKPNKRKHKGGTVEFWTEDDVKWTEEGIATMGLLAQQMEMAEFKSRQYAEAIDDLEIEYAAGKYSESEYLEKLNELTQAQYDSIESYYDAQDAIVELNEARIDSIKEGIEAEIEAYEELIDKKKEALSTEKDLYDFQRGVAEQQKSIAQIERQLAALATDSSMSAAAKRKQLEAELATARQELEDTYYDRSVENRQNALDKELEDFQTEKDIEMKKWEEYLTNVETIVAESLTIVQANAAGIYDVLNSKAQEYDLTLSPALTTPWEDGALAVWEYQEQFDTSMSSTMGQLEALKTKWQEVIDKMVEYANTDISNQHVANEAVITTPKVPEAPAPAPDPSPSNPNENTSSAVPVAVGGTAIVKKTATHFSSLSKNLKMASFVPGGKYTVYETSGSGNNMQVLLGRNGVYTGWVKLTDLEGYAKGSKGIEEDQWAMLDELGEELVIHAGKDGRVEYLTKGSGVLTHDLTERLMNLAMNPQDVLDRSRPQFTPSKSVVNNTMEIKIDASVGELIHVDRLDGNNPAEISKVIDKAWEKKMQTLNNAMRRFTR